VVTEPKQLQAWAEKNGTTAEEAVASQNEDYKKLLKDSMNALAVAQKLNSLEKPKEIYFTLDAFSVENDMLTPTFKLKRNVGKNLWKQQIDEMYAKIPS
jgi:long-chain acyl-CoA synthetase